MLGVTRAVLARVPTRGFARGRVAEINLLQSFIEFLAKSMWHSSFPTSESVHRADLITQCMSWIALHCREVLLTAVRTQHAQHFNEATDLESVMRAARHTSRVGHDYAI